MKSKIPLNPYIAGNPVIGPEHFFGREDVFREVMRVLRNPHSNAIVLYGQRRIGKTSILQQLEQRLTEGGQYTPIYFDLQYRAATPLSEVLYELAQRIASATGQPLSERDRFDSDGVYFRQTFLPAAASKAAAGGLVLLFDEFEVLDDPQRIQAGQTFFPYLREWMEKVDKVKFYFVIGRRPDELTKEIRGVFKGVPAARISLLGRKDAEAVIRQSQKDGSLIWTDEAIEEVWKWTQGHPYLTQSLCSVIWDNAHEDEPSHIPRIDAAAINSAVEFTLKKSANALHWIWDGLPPPERVAMAAIAEAGDVLITPDKLVEIYNRSGMRLVLRELELAPENLAEWELLRPVDNGYRVVVPLLRLWVATNKPLQRVILDALDQLDPLADNLFKTAQGYYLRMQPDEAVSPLRQALRMNPNHLSAMKLLGRILLEKEQFAESVAYLEEAFKCNADAGRADLIKSLLAFAEKQPEAEQLKSFDRVLQIDPNQPKAKDGRVAIWTARGESYLLLERWSEARAAFQEAGNEAKINETDRRQHKYEFDRLVNETARLVKAKDWNAAIAAYETLIKDYGDLGDFQKDLEFAQAQASLSQRYDDALKMLEDGDREQAQRMLKQIVSEQPDFKEALRYLMLATLQIDVGNYRLYKDTIKARGAETQPAKPPKSAWQDAFEAIMPPKPAAEATTEVLPQPQPFESPFAQTKPDVQPIPSPGKLSDRLRPVLLVFWQQLNRTVENYLKLLLWSLIKPQALAAHEATLNDEDKKRLKRDAGWLASSLLWWPLLIWAMWAWLNPADGQTGRVKFWLPLIFAGAWLLTGLIANRGTIPRAGLMFNFKKQPIKIPNWGVMLSAIIFVVIIALILSQKISALLVMMIIAAAAAIVVAWKAAGAAALIVAAGVVFGVALSKNAPVPKAHPQNGVDSTKANQEALGKNFPESESSPSAKPAQKGSVPIEETPPAVLPTAQKLAEDLKISLPNNRPQAAIIAKQLKDSLNTSAQKYKNILGPIFGRSFHDNAVVFLLGDDPESQKMVAFLTALQDDETFPAIKGKFSAIGPAGKRRCLEVVTALANADNQCDIKEWLASEWIKNPSDIALKEMALKFMPFKTPPLLNRFQLAGNFKTALDQERRTDAANYALLLSANETLASLAMDEEVFKKLSNGDLIKKALASLASLDACLRNHVVALLSKLKTMELPKKIADDFWKAETNSDLKGLYLKILRGMARSLEREEEITNYLNKIKKTEPSPNLDKALDEVLR